MDPRAIEALLLAVRDGEASVADALAALRELPFESDGDLALDHHRELRTGLVEAVYGEHKRAEQIARALRAIADRGQPALATRVDAKSAEQVSALEPGAVYDATSRTLRLGAPAPTIAGAKVAVVSAGAADAPVVEEAAVTLETFGAEPVRVRDVGVAGIHRLLARRAELDLARVVIVVAGMEGALPSVVGGLLGAPIVAVPTSVGYGAGLGGVTALLGMLSSCAPGVTVVNIDNGYGAACAALRILKSGISKGGLSRRDR
jgi:hypothetical protein